MVSEPEGKTYFFFSVIVFPSGHFIILPKPFDVRSCCRCRRRCRISLLSVTFSSQLFFDQKPQISRRTRPIYTSEETPPKNNRSSPAACLPCAGSCVRVWARDPLSGDEISYLGSSGAVLLTHPSGGPPEPSLSTFLPISAPPHSVSRYSPRFGSLFFISSSTTLISSSTTVIRPPIRALFNPNVIQSLVKWI